MPANRVTTLSLQPAEYYYLKEGICQTGCSYEYSLAFNGNKEEGETGDGLRKGTRWKKQQQQQEEEEEEEEQQQQQQQQEFGRYCSDEMGKNRKANERERMKNCCCTALSF